MINEARLDREVKSMQSIYTDLQARYELSELLTSRQDYGPAMHQLLEIVKRDRTFRNDIARRRMLELFDMAAAEPDLVAEYRSRLSSLLF